MTQSLFSPQWYRVAALHPRLRAQVRVQRQRWRDQLWFLLSDDATGRQHLINDSAYQFIGRCDGQRQVQQVWDAVLADRGEAAPTQDEVIELLAQLDENELLQCEHTPDTESLFRRSGERKKKRRRALINPFAFRLPLGDPSRWLAPLDPLGRLVFRPATAWVALVVFAMALLAAGSEWAALTGHAQHLLSPRHLMLAWLSYPLIKALHEIGHGMAVRRWGGEVHEFGIGLMALVPAPYVDASASAGFALRRQRALVAAAGILVELALASLALGVWLLVQPGWVRDIAFVVMFIAGVSTLFFNANPLLRFDGYYVLCDALDLPNLATRSSAWWRWWLRRVLLHQAAEPPQTAAGERKWLVLYAPLSLAYRAVLALALVLWLGGKWLLLGVFGAVYLLAVILLRPLWSFARLALTSAAPGAERRRVRLALAGAGLVAGALVFAVPLPFSTVAPAVVWLPEPAQLRTEVAGFVSALPVGDGQLVAPGELVAVLDNPELVAQRERVASRLERLRADQTQMLSRDPLAAQNLNEDIEHAVAELALADERLAQLELHAGVVGRLDMPRQADLIGSYARRGAMLGHLFGGVELQLRSVVAEDDAFLVRNQTRAVEVRLAADPTRVHSATLRQAVPAATRVLPAATFGEPAGGPYPVDPADKDGLASLQPVFIFDLAVPGGALQRVGERAWVRFDHGAQPLAFQAWRRAAQLLLEHFEPGG